MKLPCLFILFLPFAGYAQKIDTIITKGHFTLKGVEFQYQKIESGLYYDKNGKISRSEAAIQFVLSHDGQILLTHTLKDEESDCNSTSLELGDFAITDSTIKLYSYWAGIGGCCGWDHGSRMQVYAIDKNGLLKMVDSKIFLEHYKYKISEMDKEEKENYIAKIEKEYNAKFVTGQASFDLVRKVKERLAKQISIETDDWVNSPLAIHFGYRR